MISITLSKKASDSLTLNGKQHEGLPVPRHALGPRASALTATRYTRLGHASMGAHTPGTTWTPGGLYGGHARNSPHRLVTESRTWTWQGESRRNSLSTHRPLLRHGVPPPQGIRRSCHHATQTCAGGTASHPRRRLARRESKRASATGTHAHCGNPLYGFTPELLRPWTSCCSSCSSTRSTTAPS
jgi:hypothetical protein